MHLKRSTAAVINRKARERGFTLIELVIAFAILSVMMMLTFSSLSGVLRSKQALDDIHDNRAIADAIILRMSRELQLADATNPLLPPQQNTPASSAPSQGVYLYGESHRIDQDNAADLIMFTAKNGGQYIPDRGTQTELVQITYRAAKDPDQESSPDATYYLVREEIPVIHPAEKAYAQKMVFPVAKNLVSLKFRYYFREDTRDTKWYEDWGRENRVKLPAIIEFTVKIKSPKGVVDTFTTSVPLRQIGDQNS